MTSAPSALSEEFYASRKRELEERVSAKRLDHIEGVAETACHLARTYGVDEDKAYLAGLLHDWDKGLDDEEIRARVEEVGLADVLDPWVVEHMPQVLHGPTAARALSQAFPEIPADVIDAISKHTTASSEMSDLAKILYVADAIEPGRQFDGLADLRSLIGKESLDELYYLVYKFWTMALIDHDIVLYPETIAIWNHLASLRSGKKSRWRRRGSSKKRKK